MTTTRGDLSSALDLLERSRATLAESAWAESAVDRYMQAHLGALRAGAALIAAKGDVRRGRTGTVWDRLVVITPEFREWAVYFAASGERRRDIEVAADGSAPPWREADDLLRAAEAFLALVQAALGLPVTVVPERVRMFAAEMQTPPQSQPGEAALVLAREA